MRGRERFVAAVLSRKSRCRELAATRASAAKATTDVGWRYAVAENGPTGRSFVVGLFSDGRISAGRGRLRMFAGHFEQITPRPLSDRR